MYKLIAYLLAIFSLYRKQLFWLFLSLLVVMLLIPVVKQTDPQRIVPVATEEGTVTEPTHIAAKVGQKFLSLAELMAVENAAGFVSTGRFGESWPATVTEIVLADDEVSFTRQNGTRHTYRGFGGYRMKVVRLFSDRNKEVIVVFRSKTER